MLKSAKQSQENPIKYVKKLIKNYFITFQFYPPAPKQSWSAGTETRMKQNELPIPDEIEKVA
jgi:hypothetical protein